MRLMGIDEGRAQPSPMTIECKSPRVSKGDMLIMELLRPPTCSMLSVSPMLTRGLLHRDAATQETIPLRLKEESRCGAASTFILIPHPFL